MNISSAQSVRLGSVKVNSIRPTSFTSLAATVTVELASEREKTVISDINAVIYSRDGRHFANASCADVTVPTGKSTVVLNGIGALASDVGFMSFFRNISLDPNAYTADVICTVKTGGGEPHGVVMKGVSVGQYR